MSYRPKIKTNTSGGLIDFPLDAETVKGVDVVNTKQDVIDNDHKLSSDLVDDTNQNNKFVNANEKAYVSEHTLNSLNLLDINNPIYVNGNHRQILIKGVIGQTYTIKAGINNDRYRVQYENSGNFVINDVYDTNAHSYTLTEEYYRVIIWDITLLSNIMLNEGSEAQPYQPHNQKEHITNDEATLLKKEEEKCRNLLPNSKNITAQNINVFFDVNIEVGKTYTFSINGGTNSGAYALWTDMDGTQVQVITESTSVGSSKTFTATGNANRLGLYPNNISGANIMLNEGSEAKPYQEYKGKIMHEADVQAIQGAIAYTDRDNQFSQYQSIGSSNNTPLRLNHTSNNSDDVNIEFNKNGTWIGYFGFSPSTYKPRIYSKIDNAYHNLALDEDKLDKVEYEYNKKINYGGSERYTYIGDFPMDDSNVTIEVSSTIDTTSYGVLVIATQNINTSRGGVVECKVYGDADNRVSPNFRVQYSSGSINFKIYYDNRENWCKAYFHIKASTNGAPDIKMQVVSSLPTTDLLTIYNALSDNYLKLSGGTMTGGKLFLTSETYQQAWNGSNGIFRNSAAMWIASSDRRFGLTYSGVDGYIFQYNQTNATYNIFLPTKDGTMALTSDIKWFTLLWSGNSTNPTGYDASNYSHFLVKLTYYGWVICKKGEGTRYVYGTDYTTSSFYIFFSSIVCANTSASISSYKYYVASGNVYKDSYTNYISEVYGFNL